MHLPTEVVATVTGLEHEGDIAGAVDYLSGLDFSERELDATARSLVGLSHHRTAFGLASYLVNRGWNEPGTRIFRGFLAGLLGDRAVLRADLEYLQRQPRLDRSRLDAVMAADDAWFVSAFRGLWRTGRLARIDELGRLFLAVDNRFAPFFDDGTTELGRQAEEPVYAATRSPTRSVRPLRAVVAFHDRRGPGSRARALGPRLVAGLNRGGWKATLHSFSGSMPGGDYHALAEHCEAESADVVLVDHPQSDDGRLDAVLARLARGRRVVGIFPDTADPGGWPAIVQTARHLDLVWTLSPAAGLWLRPELREKRFVAPYHMGVDAGHSAPEMADVIFTGSLTSQNWPRILWLTAAARDKLRIATILTDHADNGLPAMDGYRHYLARAHAGGVVFSTAMRGDFGLQVTGRPFEATLSDALLIQEHSEDLDYFFAAGRHYLPFRTAGDLRKAFDLLRNEPERAQQIRLEGTRFAREHYSDQALTAALGESLLRSSRRDAAG